MDAGEDLATRVAGVVDRAHARRDLDADAESAVPTQVIADLRNCGFLVAPLPLALGGSGLGVVPGTQHQLLLTLKEVGRAALSAGRLYEGHVDALLLVARFGTAEQQARVARRVVDTGMLLGVWNTGPVESGVRLTPDRDVVRLDGRKTFASGAGYVGDAVITGQLPDGGWQMCLVPVADLVCARTAGVDDTSWRPLGMQGSASYSVDFRDAVVPRDLLLGVPGAYYDQPRFTGGAARFAAVQLGGAERLVDALRTFLRDAGRADDPYQLARVGEAATLVAGGNAWLRAAADAAEAFAAREATSDRVDAARLVAHVNMTRTAVLECCLRVCEIVERSVGARGLVAPHPFASVVRDLLMYLRQPAPDAAIADVGRFVLAASERVGTLWSTP